MIVGLLILIQTVLAEAVFCPLPLQGKSGGNLSVMTESFGPFDSKKCILEQVGNPSNCHCEGQEKVFAEKSQIDANDLYKQAIDEATEDAYIKSYQSTIKQIFQGTIAADVYLKDKKLKEEDLIRFNGCRPNAMFEVIKDLESQTDDCLAKPHFKRRLAKLVGSRKMNLIEAEEDKKALAKKSVSDIIESGKNAFYGQITAVAQNIPTDPKYCVPYKAYLEFTKGDTPAGESWQELTHPTNQSDYGMPENFPFKGSMYQMDLYNSEDQMIKDYLSKGQAPLEDLGFMKGFDDEPQADPKEMLENQMKREMRRVKAIEGHPFLATILNDQELRKIYEKFVGNEDESVIGENGIIKDADFMKKIMEVQNKKCKSILEKEFIKGLLCGELPKPSKEVYASKILPSLYRNRENYPAPGLSYALVKKYNDNYCPKKPSRPGAPVKSDVAEENVIEKVLSPLTTEMSGLELIDSPFADESGYAKFNEKMCSGMKKCGKSGKCDNMDFWGEEMATNLLSKISPEKIKELADEKGIDVETLKKQLIEALSKSLKSRIDDEEDELLADIKSLVEDEDEELVEQMDTFVRFHQRKNMQFPKESVASLIATCKDGDKCNDPSYWGERTGRDIYQKLSEQDRAYLAKQFKITPDQLESELIKSMQGKLGSKLEGSISTADIVSDLGLQALGALETKDRVSTQNIRDLISYSQERNSLGLKIADIPQKDTMTDSSSVTSLLMPEGKKAEGRSLFSDYAINGERKDQTALEELAPVLAERDRNPIGINTPIEIPYQRRVDPAPPSSDFSTPIPETPVQNESAPVSSGGNLAGNDRSIERNSKTTSNSGSEIINTSKAIVPSNIVTTPIKTETEKPTDSNESGSIKPVASSDGNLNDAISRAQKALKDYERLKNQAPKNDPLAQAEVDRLRRELDSARQNIEDTKRAISDVRNSNNRAPASSNDYGNPFGGASSGNGGSRVLADPYDPQSLPTAQVASIDPGASDSITSGSVNKGGGVSSDQASGGPVAPKGSLSPSQALSSLQGKGVVGGSQGLLAYMFEDVISHRLLMGNTEDVLNMIKILGLEGMNFKTVEALRDQSGDIKYLVRFFSLESADADGVIKGASSDPLKMCKKPFDDAKERMKAFEQIQSYREKSQDMFLNLVAKNMCVEKEVMIGYDEYQALANHLLDQEKMRQRVYAIAKYRSKNNGKVKRGIASEAE